MHKLVHNTGLPIRPTDHGDDNTSLPIWPTDHGDDRKTTGESPSLQKYLGEKNCGSEKRREVKNGGAKGGGWWGRVEEWRS